MSEDARERCALKGISFDLQSGREWCDLVILRGSLQHLDRPIQTLFDAYGWLRPGGWLVALATPNAGGPIYRLFQELPALDPPRNFVVFSDRVLRQCLVNVGFQEPSFDIRTSERRTHDLPATTPQHCCAFSGCRVRFSFWRNMMECYAQK